MVYMLVTTYSLRCLLFLDAVLTHNIYFFATTLSLVRGDKLNL